MFQSAIKKRVYAAMLINFSKCNKEKPPSVGATNDIDRHSMVLDSVNFYLK